MGGRNTGCRAWRPALLPLPWGGPCSPAVLCVLRAETIGLSACRWGLLSAVSTPRPVGALLPESAGPLLSFGVGEGGPGGEAALVESQVLAFVYGPRGGLAPPRSRWSSACQVHVQGRPEGQCQGRISVPGGGGAQAAAASPAPAKGSRCPFRIHLGRSSVRTGWRPPLLFEASSVPAPSGCRPGCADRRGVGGGQWRGARGSSALRPLLREPRADGLMGQKRSAKGDRSGL